MSLALLLALAVSQDWPTFRGPESAGLSPGSPPTTWNADPQVGPDRNLRWKTPIPGLSHSSPILWGDRLFTATVIRAAGEAPLKVGLYGSGDPADDDDEQRWAVVALDRRSGKILWEKTACEGKPRARRHPKATHGNTTLATDGRRLIAFFGSEGLYAFDLDGALLWKKDLGVIDSGPQGTTLQWGHASSPRIFQDRVLIQADQRKGSFLAAFALEDGKELWRTSREGVSVQSWATPNVVETVGRTQVVCNGFPFIASYEVATGKELWRVRSGGDIPVPTPVFAEGLIFVTNAHGAGAPLYAIRPDASGDVTPADGQTSSAGVAWSEPRNGAYMQTPLVLEGLVYSCSDRGVLKVYEAATGKLQYQQRLGSGKVGFTASPVAAGGRIYFSSEEGEVFVLKAGPRFELLATNRCGEILMATAAASGNDLYFRTQRRLIAVGP